MSRTVLVVSTTSRCGATSVIHRLASYCDPSLSFSGPPLPTVRNVEEWDIGVSSALSHVGASALPGDVRLRLLDFGRPFRSMMAASFPMSLDSSQTLSSNRSTASETATASLASSSSTMSTSTMHPLDLVETCDGIVFVVDSTETDLVDGHLSKAQLELFFSFRRRLAEMRNGGCRLAEPLASNAIVKRKKKWKRREYPRIVILANKQDFASACSVETIVTQFGLVADVTGNSADDARSASGNDKVSAPFEWIIVPTVANAGRYLPSDIILRFLFSCPAPEGIVAPAAPLVVTRKSSRKSSAVAEDEVALENTHDLQPREGDEDELQSAMSGALENGTSTALAELKATVKKVWKGKGVTPSAPSSQDTQYSPL